MCKKIVAIQMDHLTKINKQADSTLMMIREAERRNYVVYCYHVDDVFWKDGNLFCNAWHISIVNNEIIKYKYIENFNLAGAKVILMRQDPPFNMNYISYTYLLELIKHKTLIINDPKEVRNCVEKLWCLYFQDLIPATIISRNKNKLIDFFYEYKHVVVKPVYGCRGMFVTSIKYPDKNISSLLDMYFANEDVPVIMQEYIPDIAKGDKRIILIDGEPYGAVLRVPKEQENRANLHLGSSAVKTTLTDKDLYICKRLAPELKRKNLLFVGIDVIGDYLIEVNVTSPTGIVPINKLNNICLENILWDKIEEKMTRITH